jgi:hypothetical protein
MPREKKIEPAITAAKITSRVALTVGILGVIGVITAAVINKGCLFAPQPQPQQTFSGRVYDKTDPNKKIGNAQVSMEGEGAPPLASSDSEGIFSFPLSDPNKEYRLKIEAKGYETYDLRVVPAKNQGIQPIALTPKSDISAEITGRVVDERDNWLEGATVSLDDYPKIEAVKTTSEGTFTIKGIPKKDYSERVRIRAAKEGYKDWVEDVTIGGQQPRIKLSKN